MDAQNLAIYLLASKPQSKSYLSFPKCFQSNLLARNSCRPMQTPRKAAWCGDKHLGGSTHFCDYSGVFFLYENNITTRSELTPGFMSLSLEGMRGTHTSSFPMYMYWTGLNFSFCRFHSSTHQPNPFCFELTHHSDSLHSTPGPVFPHVHGKEDYR